MNEIGRHITNAIEGGKVKNAADVARKIGVSRATVSRWLSGDEAPSAEKGRMLADLIGAPEGLIMAECEAARAKDDATRAAWLRVARLCSRPEKGVTTLALALVAIVAYFMTGPENLVFLPILATVGANNLPIMAVWYAAYSPRSRARRRAGT